MTVDHLVVVGASLAGLRAVEAARKSGHRGRITLIGAETHPPYDRPPLSKQFLGPGDALDAPAHLAPDAFAALEVDFLAGRRASELDTSAHRIAVGDQWIPYDAVVVATGVVARGLPGTDGLAGVHTLRTVEDARAVRAALDAGARTVVVGAGFIGSEVAAAARKRGLPVTVVEALPVPMAGAIGVEMGAAVARMHLDNGTDLRCGVKVTGVLGRRGRVTGVELSDGTMLRADLVVVGIGATPETGWLRTSGLDISDGVACDARLCAGPSGVYVAGDVARWHSTLFGRALRVEHWTNAAEQGELAARNALDPAAAGEYGEIPYFWSDCYDRKIQFVGIVDADEVRVVSGDVASRRFAALYRNGDRLVGALTMNLPGVSARCQAMIASAIGWQEAVDRTVKRVSTA